MKIPTLGTTTEMTMSHIRACGPTGAWVYEFEKEVLETAKELWLCYKPSKLLMVTILIHFFRLLTGV